MILKNVRRALVVAFVGLGACGSPTTCEPPVAANATACPGSVFVDATKTDPICLSTSGVAVCRGPENAICYVCTGASFTDGCEVRSQAYTIECVHSCSKC